MDARGHYAPYTLPQRDTWQESEAAGDEKWVAQQFVWSHPNLDFRRVLDDENHEPPTRLSEETL